MTVPPMMQIARPKKDYGSEYPQRSFLERRGPVIGFLAAGISACVVFGALVVLTIMLLPAACSHEIDRQVEIVKQQLEARP